MEGTFKLNMSQQNQEQFSRCLTSMQHLFPSALMGWPPVLLCLLWVIHSPSVPLVPAAAARHQKIPELLIQHVKYRLKREDDGKSEAGPAVSDTWVKMVPQLSSYAKINFKMP